MSYIKYKFITLNFKISIIISNFNKNLSLIKIKYNINIFFKINMRVDGFFKNNF